METVSTLKEHQRNVILDRLVELGVTRSRCGRSVYDLDYDALKVELVMVTNFDNLRL